MILFPMGIFSEPLYFDCKIILHHQTSKKET